MGIEDYLTDDERVYRRTSGARNAYGEATDTWALVCTIKGTIQLRSGNTSRTEGGILTNYTAVLYCLVGSNINEDDKILDKNNVYYNILSIKDASNRGHHLEVFLNRIE